MKVHNAVPILNVSDVPASLRFFEVFGFQTEFTWNSGGMIADARDEDGAGRANFAGLCSRLEGSSAQIFLSQDSQGARPGRPPRSDGSEDFGAVWIYLFLDSPAEVDAAHQAALANGIGIFAPPADQPWGMRELIALHPDGHVLRIGTGIGGEEREPASGVDASG